MLKRLFLMGLSLSLFSMNGIARDKRVNQIPNGSKFTCGNCHNGMGGPRNAFGLTIQSGYLTEVNANGNVIWGAALAALDSDGDTFSNGVELQDPSGAWTTGSPAPGVFASVTNPGTSTSKPPSAVEDRDGAWLPLRPVLHPNFPNPFNPSTQIRFVLPKDQHVTLKIHDVRGREAIVLVDGKRTAGEHVVLLDASNLASGVYFAVMQTDGFRAVQRMLLVK
ncbi:MAG: T9SS type A sorting domain-containing protein [bacterium]|nr:T9SS type A sorting domain-containing protein [bacterium]